MDFLTEILKEKEFKKYEKIKDFTIKTYQDSDEADLISLYLKVFPHVITDGLIEWKNRKNPFENADKYTFLMKDKETIISQYAVVPKIFIIYGKEYKCIQSLGTMTHPAYRGLGIFPYLAKIAYEYAKRKGHSFVYGFPNEISEQYFKVKLNWTIFSKLNLFYKDLSSSMLPKIDDDNYIIKEIEVFDEKVNKLWNKIKPFLPIIIKKDKDYLNWRFVNHPSENYKKYIVLNNTNRKICAYFILKKFKDKNNNLNGHIIDFLIDPKDKNLERKIFTLIEGFSINEFKKDCTRISFWLPNENLKNLTLKSLNYNLIQMNANFGFKIFKTDKQFDLLKDQKSWYITMGNSDVF
ncbi:MAG: GNAT family N-acetyltransferase [Candidatus Hodarchaeota archaeon]